MLQHIIVHENDLGGQGKEMLTRKQWVKRVGSPQWLNSQRKKLRKDPFPKLSQLITTNPNSIPNIEICSPGFYALAVSPIYCSY